MLPRVSNQHTNPEKTPLLNHLILNGFLSYARAAQLSLVNMYSCPPRPTVRVKSCFGSSQLPLCKVNCVNNFLIYLVIVMTVYFTTTLCVFYLWESFLHVHKWLNCLKSKEKNSWIFWIYWHFCLTSTRQRIGTRYKVMMCCNSSLFLPPALAVTSVSLKDWSLDSLPGYDTWILQSEMGLFST